VDDTVCVVNIGPQQRRRRRNLGVASLALGAAVVAVSVALGLPPPARLASAAFFFGGFAGIFQARAKT
jgi:hypothetical protein